MPKIYLRKKADFYENPMQASVGRSRDGITIFFMSSHASHNLVPSRRSKKEEGNKLYLRTEWQQRKNYDQQNWELSGKQSRNPIEINSISPFQYYINYIYLNISFQDIELNVVAHKTISNSCVIFPSQVSRNHTITFYDMTWNWITSESRLWWFCL